ncbi:MAG: ribosomal protein L13e [Candidatus Bathyarchaeia archaeon]
MTAIKAKVTSPCGKPRLGKGFSRGELKEAGSDRAEALRLKIPLDEKRKSVHAENIEALKAFLSANRLAKKPKPDKNKAKS